MDHTVFTIPGPPLLTAILSSPAKGQCVRVPSTSPLTYRALGVAASFRAPSSPLPVCTQVCILCPGLLCSPNPPLNSAPSLLLSVLAFTFFNRKKKYRYTEQVHSKRLPRASQIPPYWLSFLIQLSSGLSKNGVDAAATSGAELWPTGVSSTCTLPPKSIYFINNQLE